MGSSVPGCVPTGVIAEESPLAPAPSEAGSPPSRSFSPALLCTSILFFFFFFKWRAEYFKQTLLNIYNLWARLQRRRSVAVWCRGWLSLCSSLPPLLFAVTWRGRRDEPRAAPRKFPAQKEEKPPVCLLWPAGASLSPLPSICPRELHQDQGLSSKALLVPIPSEPQLVPQAARGRVLGLFFNGSGGTFASIN